MKRASSLRCIKAPVRRARLTGLRLPLVLFLLAGAANPHPVYAQWWKDIDGCLAYEHRGFEGAKFTVDATMTYSYVGSRWNDRISSVLCEVFCSLTVWEHRDYAGATRVFGPDTTYVGSAWNDRISSMEANCEP